jgi:molecular chaperone DnaJ
MVATRDYYAVLGVRRDADEQEIKNAFRDAALRWHPDRNANDPTTAERFKEALAAYEVLRDPQKRRIYDRSRTFPEDAVPNGVGRKWRRGCGAGRRGCSKRFNDLRWKNYSDWSFSETVIDVSVDRIGAMLGCEVKLSLESLFGHSVVTLRLPSGLSEGDVLRTDDVNPLYVRIHVTD